MIKTLMGVALLGMCGAGCAVEVGNAEAENIDSTEQAATAQAPVAATQAATEQAALLAATKAMQEQQMSFNLQYLQLQAQMQAENRAYTAVSNIMKTKHDTVKNTISNVR